MVHVSRLQVDTAPHIGGNADRMFIATLGVKQEVRA